MVKSRQLVGKSNGHARRARKPAEQIIAEVAGDAKSMTAVRARKLFDAAADRYLGMSGEEFIEKFDSGYWASPDSSGSVMYVDSLRRFAE